MNGQDRLSHHWSAPWLLVSALAACVAAPELEPDIESPDIAAVELDLDRPTPGTDTLLTSMNFAAGSTNFGCWDMPRSGSPRWLGQWPCHGRNHQLFVFEPVGVGYRIKSRHDMSRCLDVPSFNYVPNQPVQMYPCNGGQNQVWRVQPIDSTTATIRPSPNTNLCLTVSGNVQVSPARIQLATCNSSALSQKWKLHTRLANELQHCGSAVDFDGPAPKVAGGASAAFRPDAQAFTVWCEGLTDCDTQCLPGTSPPVCETWCSSPPTVDISIDCDRNQTDLFVVDRLDGVGDYTVRCFKSDPDPPSDPEPPLGCQAGYVCCSGQPTSSCDPGDCAPSLSHCQ